MGFAGALDPFGERMKTQRAMLVNLTRAHSAPFSAFSTKEKRKKLFCFYRVYFRLRNMSAAAAAKMTMTAVPMAMYVVVGVALVGGITTALGDGDKD